MDPVDVVVVGAGFAGIYALHRLRTLGFDVRGVESAPDVGGTWYWNRYPGARCDIPSMEYSYSFDDALQQEWNWQERYASQPEILAYLRHVADRFDLYGLIDFGIRISAATWDDPSAMWTLRSTDGRSWICRHVVMATGSLSAPIDPDIAGLAEFAGPVLHTGRWPAEPVDLAGHRVGVIGTGSSGVQVIPAIAGVAQHLTVFQRTPAYTVPARNRPLTEADRTAVRERYDEFRAANRQMQPAFGADRPPHPLPTMALSSEERRSVLEESWSAGGLAMYRAFDDTIIDEAANEVLADFIRTKIDDAVEDDLTAAALKPHSIVGCKRLTVGTDYYETYNRANVTLVDVMSDPIQAVTATGVTTSTGEVALDALVLATGFDAMTGALTRIDPCGVDGVRLSAAWADGPSNLLGIAVPGFPNLFTITGAGSPSVLTNMVVSIEQHVEWVGDLLTHMREQGSIAVEPEKAAADSWVDHVNLIADLTLFTRCNSWYLGTNVPGKPRHFMPLIGFPDYAERCAQIAASGYPGFAFR